MRRSAVALLLLMVTGPVVAQHSAEDVRLFIEQRDREIKSALEHVDDSAEAREHARSLINDRIDFEEMGRRALGRFDADLAADTREEYIETFAAIVRGQSLSDLSVYNAHVTIDNIDVTGDQSSVWTRAQLDNTTLQVQYLLHFKGDSWWMYDIVIDDVGTIEGYAISFQTYIRKRGMEAFLESLRRKLDRQTAST